MCHLEASFFFLHISYFIHLGMKGRIKKIKHTWFLSEVKTREINQSFCSESQRLVYEKCTKTGNTVAQ